jgi:GAF domain-containing protein
MATSFTSISDALFHPDAAVVSLPGGPRPDLALSLLERIFGTRFGVLDLQADRWLSRQGDLPSQEFEGLVELCHGIVCAERPEIIAYEDPFAVLALPLNAWGTDGNAAVATFVIRTPAPEEDLSRSARALGMEPAATAAWAQRQTTWAADALCAAGNLVVDHLAALRKIDRIEIETESLAANLASTCEEINLLHRLTQNLRILQSDEEFGRMALQWMDDAIPAEGMAIAFLADDDQGESPTQQGRIRPTLLSLGCCPVDALTFTRLVDHLKLPQATRPIVVSRRMSGRSDWPFPQVRQCIAVPLVEGENLFGWLAAFNHVDDAEFGTVEASLLSSIAAILGIHRGNIELYRHQAKRIEGVVRALTSAIGCEPETLDTIKLSALLHEIEKIDVIFRAGAGRQEDPAVVAALLRCRDEVRQILHEGPAPH